ncbi:hypothetical protein AB0N05_16755 [Nocardia sp. NPDC051030]|uniref:hypothetical protein n=1 Tax=Nocardia sp. NPDC051030 TaxID=3155162 RepID=UPI003422BD7A
MFESCHSPFDAAHLLRARYGLPVELFADRPFLISGRTVEAIALPTPLARQVRNRLIDLPSIPAIADPRNRRWTFLVTPPIPYHPVPQQLQSRLTAHGATLPRRGDRIMLPLTDYQLACHWASEPEPGHLRMPHRATIISALRATILDSTAEIA